jgi:hypothetical protein
MLGRMRRYLVVANRTLGGHELLDRVRDAVRVGPCHFTVLVPADDRDTDAPRRLSQELTRLREVGADADGREVAADPFDAVARELADREYDEVIVCTLPPGVSRWLRADLVSRVERVTDLPVSHVFAPAGWPERISYRAQRLTIYVGESDRAGHGPLYSEIVRRARAAGLAGATVLRGVEGFGASSVIHTARLLTMSEDLPMVVVIIDTPEHIETFLPELDELLTEGLVVRENIDVVKYAGRRETPT